MIVTDAAIRRSTTVLVVLPVILVVGVYAYLVLPRESEPEVVIPYISVAVTYEGVSPEDMESLVTVPIERKLTGISEIKRVRSTSVEGVSHILVEFEPDTDIEDALQKVRDKVDMAKSDLPADADDPIVSEINISEFPIMVMSLTGNVPLAVLDKFAQDFEDRIETVKGVLDVKIIGGIEREIQIEVDPDRVAQYGISFADLIQITKLENVNTPGGAMDLGEGKYLMRTPGEFQTPEELENLVVKMSPSGVVYLRDIATVKDAFKEVNTISRVDEKPAVTLAISKRAGENIIEIAEQVRAIVREMSARLPAGVEVAMTWDSSTWVRDMVSELENSILSGLILIMGIVFVVLGFTNAVFVASAIPISMLITFSVLYFTDVTLNMVVLFSLTLALGMLVDNGIVVVENIYRHLQEGSSRLEAAQVGAAEVAGPVCASTITTVAAFVPMFFWPGIFGDFMYYLPMTVTVALSASLFVGLVVNPALASRFMRLHRPKRSASHPFLRTYEALLRLALHWRLATVTLAVVGLVVIGTVFRTVSKVEFLPEIEPPQAYIDIECPEGANLATSDMFVRGVERIVRAYRANVEHVIANVGFQGVDIGGEGSNAPTTHLSRVTLDFPPLETCEVLPSQTLDHIRADIESIFGAEVRIAKMGMGPPTGPPINVEISGDDFELLAQLAEQVKEKIKHVPGVVDLRDDYNRGKPEVKIIVDRQQAWRTGLNTQLIGLTVQAAIDGRKAGDFREGDEEYDVMVRFPKTFREDLSNLESMHLINIAGQAIPFSTVARVEQSAGLGSIKRMNRKRTVTVSAEVEGELPAAEVLEDVKILLTNTFELPAGYSLSFTGENEDLEETEAFLKRAFAMAVFLIALILVTQFNSITQPFIIMTAVLLSLGGVLLGLLIFNMPFGILMTGIACISLAGVVVNNGIVMVDFINQLRKRGLAIEEAIVRGGVIRLRPVLLTATTTILGLVPMALGVSFNFREFRWSVGGETSQFWGPMAIAVIFGLTFATVLTLVVVPTLYSLFDSLAGLVTRPHLEPQLVPSNEPQPK